ncbi:sporulation integral membrane protein YtvI [Clostridium sp. MB05]|uniref:sporulation integral membrane protein YtvI n=1 Tax=Clostridium sp. MB05 TaxID=3376682 RepID=UPI0039825353
MGVEKKREFIINTIYLIIVGAIIYITIKYGLGWFMPFVIGFGIAFILKPLINFISSKFRINRKLVAGITVLIFYATVGALFALLVVKLFVALKSVFISLPNIYLTNIEPAVYDLLDGIEVLIAKLDPALVQGINDITSSLVESLGSIITNISSGVVKFVSSTVSSVPTFFIIVILSIISSFFCAMDYTNITSFITRQFPDKVSSIILDIKDYIVGTLFKLIKAYAIIISITFIELSIGLSILKVEGAITIAALIALVDILPVLGTGGVVIPWVIIEAIKGNFGLAIGLAILYVTITVIRNILEPKIVGQQVGLHPLVMLVCMFMGARIFGFLGLFILPIIVIILKNLNDSGKIHIFK